MDAGRIDADRLDAVERLATKSAGLLVDLGQVTLALFAVNGALVATLGERVDRAAVREAALAALDAGPDDARAVDLVMHLTAEPAAAGPGAVSADAAEAPALH